MNMKSIDLEKLAIKVTLTFMEAFGVVTLLCGILDIQIF